MNLELIKSYALAILVLLSLLLTFILWNYKPNFERVFDTDYVDEINLGGTDKKQEEIVQPESIIFKRHDKYFGFSSPRDTEEFYNEMQSWVLYDFWSTETNGPPNDDYQVEVIFPDAISLDVLPGLFDMNEDVEELPQWSFRRMYLTLDEETSTLNVFFLSVDGRYRAKAVVNNVAKQNNVREHIESLEGMVEYIPLLDTETPIYIRKDTVNVPRHTVTINTIDQKSLVNALFSDPSAVRRNVIDDETFYTDGQRQMSINRGLMKFVNPYQSYEPMSLNDLLERSIKDINDHNGWTDTYHLQEIDLVNNQIQYQMHYKGYPVYNRNGLSTIKQEWHDQERIQYNRPLFSINDSLVDDEVELRYGYAIKY